MVLVIAVVFLVVVLVVMMGVVVVFVFMCLVLKKNYLVYKFVAQAFQLIKNLCKFCFHSCIQPIEEGFIKKPRQTVVVAFWGKNGHPHASISLCSRRIVKRRAGSILWGDICILHILYGNRLIGFPSNFV